MSRNVNEETTERELEEPDETGNVSCPKYGPWISLYGSLHRYVGRRTAIFGGTATLGLLVLVRQFYAFTFGLAKWSLLPPRYVLGGVFLFGFGVGYYVVRDDTSCPECGTAFSQEQVSKRPVQREPGGSAGVHIQETVVCQSCGNRETDVYRQPEKEHPRF